MSPSEQQAVASTCLDLVGWAPDWVATGFTGTDLGLGAGIEWVATEWETTGVGALYVRFRDSGKSYRYDGVPTNVFEGLLFSSSKGRTYNKFVKGRFNCVPL